MADEDLSRRRFIARLAPGIALAAGCGAAGPATSTPTAGGDGADRGGNAGGTRTETPTPTPTATPTPTPTPSPAATPSLQAAAVPPGDAVTVADTDLSLRRGDYYTDARASITLRNEGAYVFTRLELRVELYYHPPGDDPVRVADTYVERSDFDGDGDADDDVRDTFAPGEETTLVPSDLRFRPDGRAGDTTDSRRFSLEVVFRRVEYRPARSAGSE